MDSKHKIALKKFKYLNFNLFLKFGFKLSAFSTRILFLKHEFLQIYTRITTNLTCEFKFSNTNLRFVLLHFTFYILHFTVLDFDFPFFNTLFQYFFYPPNGSKFYCKYALLWSFYCHCQLRDFLRLPIQKYFRKDFLRLKNLPL